MIVRQPWGDGSCAVLYAIVNDRDSNVYVGTTSQLSARWIQHRSRLRHGIHGSHRLQEAWSEFGEAAFKVKILAIYPLKYDLDSIESALIAKWPSYNEHPGSIYVGGYKHSAETRAKLSAVAVQRYKDPEERCRLSERARQQPREGGRFR